MSSNVKCIETIDSINVKEWGAIGDGKHDDTKAIQSALYESSSSNRHLFFPEGEYLISKKPKKDYALLIPSNTTILGTSCQNTVIKLNSGHSGFTRMLKIKNVENVFISNFSFDGNIENQAKKDEHQSAIAIVSAENIEIRNSIFHSTGGDGVIIRGPKVASKNIAVSNCYFHTNGRNGLTLGSGFDNVNIEFCHFDVTHTHASPIDSEPTSGKCANVIIANNTFINCRQNATIMTFGGRPWVDNYTFENNVIENIGLHMVRSKNVVVKNNYINISDSSRYAVRMIYGNVNNKVYNNEFHLEGANVMQLTKVKGEYPENISFSDNYVHVNENYKNNTPFQLRGVSNINISNNKINFENKLNIPLVTIRPTGPMLDISITDNSINNITELISIYRSINDNIDNLVVKNNKLLNSSTLRKRSERTNLDFLNGKNIIIE